MYIRRAPAPVLKGVAPKEVQTLTLPRDGAEAAKIFKKFPREQRAAFVNNYWMQLKAFYETGKFPDAEAFETSHKFMIELVKDPAFKRLKPYVELGDISHQTEFTHPSSLYDFVERNKTDYPDIVSDVNSWRSKVRERSVRPDIYDNDNGGVSAVFSGAAVPAGKGPFTGDSNMLPVPYKEPVAEPKEGVVVGPETSKPGVDTPLAEENPAAASSPEVKAAGAEGTPKAETVTDKTEAKTPPETSEIKDGALTGKDGKPAEPSKGLFSKIGSHLGRNWGRYALGIAGLGYAINDLASKDSTLKSWFTENHSPLDANNPSTNQPHIKSLDQREGAYIPERLLKFRQNTQEPFVNNTNVNVDADGISSNEELPVQQEQQVINALTPVNNATTDYVRAAYNSYIPSDAGRAYQRAIYGDPLELDRMRLQQQQQQKWRDFVMRSGQSPAELVQRGLMPYDALQYI